MQRILKKGYQPGRHESCMSWHMCHVGHACAASACSQHRSRDSCCLGSQLLRVSGAESAPSSCTVALSLSYHDGLTFEPKATKMRQLGQHRSGFVSICGAQVVQAGSQPLVYPWCTLVCGTMCPWRHDGRASERSFATRLLLPWEASTFVNICLQGLWEDLGSYPCKSSIQNLLWRNLKEGLPAMQSTLSMIGKPSAWKHRPAAGSQQAHVT